MTPSIILLALACCLGGCVAHVDAPRAAAVVELPAVIDASDPVTEFVMGNVEYILLHEIAHLLIRDLDIPVIGPEESAADYIATAVLIRAELFDEESAARARQFLLATANGLATSWEFGANEVHYWDSHALTIQRFYQIICLVYGSDQDAFATLPGSVGMPAARASRCADEFARAGRSLIWLLENYGRKPGDPDPAQVDLVFGPPRTRIAAQLLDAIRGSGMLDNTVRRLHESFTIRLPFTIEFRSCGEVQAVWLPDERKVVFCYELLDTYYLLGRSSAARERNLPRAPAAP